MPQKDYVIQLSVNDAGAITNIDQVEKSLQAADNSAASLRTQLKAMQKELQNLDVGSEEFEKLSRQAGQLKDRINDTSEAVRANAGNAFESLSNNVGLLGDRFANLDFEGVGSSFKSIAGSISNFKLSDVTDGLKGVAGGFLEVGKAILGNPILAIGGVIALLVLNFGKIKEVLDLGVNPALRDMEEATKAASAASEQALKSFDLEERRLRALGVAEEEIAKQRRALTVQRINDLKAEATVALTVAEQQFQQLEKARSNGAIGLLQGALGPSGDEVKAQFEKAKGLVDALKEQEVSLLEFDKKITDDLAGEQKKRNSDAAAANKERSDARKAALEKEVADAKKAADEVAELTEKLYQETVREFEAAEKAKAAAAVKANEDRIKSEDAQFALQQSLTQTRQEKEISDLVASYDAKFELAAGNAELEKQLQEQLKSDLKAINDKANEQELADQKRVQAQRIQTASNVLGALTSLTDSFTAKNKQQAKKQFEINKGLQIAQALIQTYQSATAAYASQFTPGDPSSPIRAAIAAGVAVVSGLAQVNKIRQTKFDDSGGGGGTASAGGGGGGSVSFGGSSSGNNGSDAPTFNPLAPALINGQSPPPLKAYVVSGAVSSAQEADAKIADLAAL